MESSRLVGALDRGGQGAILPGKISVDVVRDRVRVLIGREVEGEHAVGQVERRGARADRALDQGGARGKVLFDDQEIALPFRRARGDVAVRREHDVGLAAQRDLAGDVLERLGIDGDAETGRQAPCRRAPAAAG